MFWKNPFYLIHQFIYQLAIGKRSGDEELEKLDGIVLPLTQGPWSSHGCFGHGSFLINNLSLLKNSFSVLCDVYKDFLWTEILKQHSSIFSSRNFKLSFLLLLKYFLIWTLYLGWSLVSFIFFFFRGLISCPNTVFLDNLSFHFVWNATLTSTKVCLWWFLPYGCFHCSFSQVCCCCCFF